MPEIIDLYDDARRIIRQATRGQYIPNGLNRMIVHAWFVNSRGDILLQQRLGSAKKFPNKWGPTGGGVQTGETSWDACVRECTEEIGITPDIKNAVWVGSFKRPKHFIDVWMIRQDINIADIKMQPDEVQSVQWASPSKILEIKSDNDFVPSTKFGYYMVLKYLQKSRPIQIAPSEMLHNMTTVKIDKPMGNNRPVNIGLIPGTRSSDGNPIRAYVLGPNIALKRFSGRVIAVIHHENSATDDMLVVAPDKTDIDNITITNEISFNEKSHKYTIIR